MMGNGLGESSQKEDNGNISQPFFWGYNTDVIGDITNNMIVELVDHYLYSYSGNLSIVRRAFKH